MAKRLLVTGASGFLGWNVALFPQASWEIIGTYYNHKNGIHPSIEALQMDLSNKQNIVDCLDKLKDSIDGILHLAAISKPNDCAKYPQLSLAVNVEATRILAQKAAMLRIPFVFTSSTQVYSGDDAPYSENSPTSPITVYAAHKILAEEAAMRANPKAVVVRMPLMFGATSPTSQNFLKEWTRKIENRELVSTFSDEYRAPVSGQTAAGVLFRLLEGKAEGELFVLGGKDSISRTDFGYAMCEALDLDKKYIRPCLQADVKMAAKRPKDLTMDTTKLEKAIGYVPKGVREELSKLSG